MSFSRRVFLTSCLAAGAFALVGRSRQATLHRERWYLFGTLVDVAIADPDRARVHQALAALSAELRTMHRDWNAWKPGMLDELNGAIARGGSAPVSPALAEMIEGMQGLHRQSDGVFNPAIGLNR